MILYFDFYDYFYVFILIILILKLDQLINSSLAVFLIKGI